MTEPQKRPHPGGNRGNTSNNSNQATNEAAERRHPVPAALRAGPLTLLHGRVPHGVRHPGARVIELRKRGRRIATMWTQRLESTGQRHRVVQNLMQAGGAITAHHRSRS